jgi:hypothetical protein
VRARAFISLKARVIATNAIQGKGVLKQRDSSRAECRQAGHVLPEVVRNLIPLGRLSVRLHESKHAARLPARLVRLRKVLAMFSTVRNVPEQC